VHAELNGVVQDHRAHIVLPTFVDEVAFFVVGKELSETFCSADMPWKVFWDLAIECERTVDCQRLLIEIFVKLKRMLSCS